MFSPMLIEKMAKTGIEINLIYNDLIPTGNGVGEHRVPDEAED